MSPGLQSGILTGLPHTHLWRVLQSLEIILSKLEVQTKSSPLTAPARNTKAVTNNACGTMLYFLRVIEIQCVILRVNYTVRIVPSTCFSFVRVFLSNCETVWDSRAVNKFIEQTHQHVCLFVICLSCIWLARIPGLSVPGYADRLDVRLHILGGYGPHWLVSGNHYYIVVRSVCVPGISLTLPGIIKSENLK